MMKKIAIISDSASDLPYDIIKKYNIKIIPLQVHFLGKTYKDGIDISPDELYMKLRDEIPKTSLPSHSDILKTFDELKEEGYTDVVYIGISSGLSGTYNFVKMLGEEYEGMNFHFFDTRTLSCAQGMLVSVASKMLKDTTDNIKDIFSRLTKIRDKMMSMFVVRDLTYLIKGGRIGKVTGIIGNIFKVCPIVNVNKSGMYEVFKKAIGFSRALNVMIKEAEKRFKNVKVAVTVVHGLEKDIAKNVLNKVNRFCNVVEENISPVTASLCVHTGPGLVGLIVREIES